MSETPEVTSQNAAASVTFRAAGPGDASDLTILADAATRRLVGWLWDDAAEPGQSSFEVGRAAVQGSSGHLAHHSRWQVAQIGDRVAGGLNSYMLPPVPDAPAQFENVLRPLNGLKARAVGTWYISVASVFPEARNLGVGTALLNHASGLAVEADIDQLTLMVGSFNEGALRLYERFGFRQWHRDAFVTFPGSDPVGDWILMVKDLD